ncbi:ribosome biogenesis GTPase Der [Criblamydia sequanensis]|uniref:GTPase Der n=1 Tax=Candidatus Criblamydia sequanensis CRIB-18 TaxID=1437425 RepID=A0A090CZA1_9BACT|nr:ribosome biogenesis GTPase Der [Criblamydia sequanensis]CDR34146.1 GTP-binding protein EngA [Criblamydia sequanensis CRIB-18]
MTSYLKLALVGRPNVGKSALFNAIAKKRVAIVDEAEGVTRDRIYTLCDFFGKSFIAVDTGGIDPRSKAPFNEEVKKQAELAIEEADTLILVVDGKAGVTLLDEELARLLLKKQKKVVLAVNKIDDISKSHLIHQFHSLGLTKIIPVSATQNWNIAELLEAALSGLDEKKGEENNYPKVAVVGRPNVGKSSLVNYLLQDDRCIVSPIPGTTRDSIDVTLIHNEKPYIFIDTAGIRRKKAEHDVVDKFAAIRTQEAIERSDICILMIDAVEGITLHDKKISKSIEDAGKGCILLINKWDLIKGFRMEHCLQGIEEEVPFLKHCPKVFTSAKTGRNVDEIFPLIDLIVEEGKKRITTHQLNAFLVRAMQLNHPPMIQGKRLRIYYMTQVDVNPPKFILFVNYASLLSDTYRKYLYNQFRKSFAFTGLPIRIHTKDKAKESRKKKAENRLTPLPESVYQREKMAETLDEQEDRLEQLQAFEDEDGLD